MSEYSGQWRAPGRVNLLGEHTDYNGGLVLPIALSQATTATVELLDSDHIELSSDNPMAADVRLDLDEVRPSLEPHWAAYCAGVVWAARRRGLPVSGFRATYTSTVPVGAGLSSSAALSCSTALALNDLLGWNLSALDLAAVARSAENDIAGAPTGVMDQLASMLGIANHALAIDTSTLVVDRVPIDLAAQGLALLVIDSHTPHALVDGEYADRRASCVEAARILGVRQLCSLHESDLQLHRGELSDVLFRRARHVITDSARVSVATALLREGRMSELGPLFDQSHQSMRNDYEITVPPVDLIQQTARSAGALGARMTGGGFGGCVIALVTQGTAQEVLDACVAANRAAGFATPTGFVATASDGARRLTKVAS